MSSEPKINKTTTYLAAAGAFATGAFLITAAPFVSIPLVAVAGVAVAVRKDRDAFIGRVASETKELWQDLKTHATKDLNSLSKWWSRVSKKAEAAAPQTPAQQPAETQSTFGPTATPKNDFAQTATPTAEKPAAPVATPAAAPAANSTPKAPGQ